MHKVLYLLPAAAAAVLAILVFGPVLDPTSFFSKRVGVVIALIVGAIVWSRTERQSRRELLTFVAMGLGLVIATYYASTLMLVSLSVDPDDFTRSTKGWDSKIQARVNEIDLSAARMKITYSFNASAGDYTDELHNEAQSAGWQRQALENDTVVYWYVVDVPLVESGVAVMLIGRAQLPVIPAQVLAAKHNYALTVTIQKEDFWYASPTPQRIRTVPGSQRYGEALELVYDEIDAMWEVCVKSEIAKTPPISTIVYIWSSFACQALVGLALAAAGAVFSDNLLKPLYRSLLGVKKQKEDEDEPEDKRPTGGKRPQVKDLQPEVDERPPPPDDPPT